MTEYLAMVATVALPVAAFFLIKEMIKANLTEEQEKDLDEMAKRFGQTKGGK